MFIVLGVLELIIVPYSLFSKKSKIKYSVLLVNIATAILLYFLSPMFAGGGGFGDLSVTLTAILILLISLIEYIIIAIQLKKT